MQSEIIHHPPDLVEIDTEEGILILTTDEYVKVLRRGHSRTVTRKQTFRPTLLKRILMPWIARAAN
jgi:hypothetical protein